MKFLCLLIIVALGIQYIFAAAATNRPKNKACSDPIYTGMCFAAIIRYAYNVTSRDCVSFTYGGCQANRNNFLTKQECRATCL
ncbi:trypsin inhibitor-like [Spodoptera litura]|uniref:Trypsin inhibitor-like n=1 Tax=Spodoptera litura TaxID=69820 RepID=A0A9J7ILH9_SPOLT|nr:trypsin inhibitor-like [Spodoptera litura]